MADNTNGRASTDGTDLGSILSDTSRSINQLSRSFSKLSDYLKDNEKEHNTFIKNFKKSGETLRDTFMDTFERTGKSVIQWGVRLFTSSFNTIQQTYLNNFSEITAKMNLAASEYTKIYQETARDLRANGLNIQFDTTDFANMLKNELAQGFRGEIAQRKTMIDLISKKLIPSIDTSSRSYILGYRKLGEDFAKMTVGLQKLNTNLGKNMEYFENNMYQTTQEMFLTNYLATGGNMEGYYQLQQSLADMTTSFGQDFVNNLVSQINQSLNGTSATLPLILAGYGTSGDIDKALFGGGASGVSNFITNILAAYTGLGSSVGYDRVALNALTSAGVIPSTVDILMAGRYGASYGVDNTRITASQLMATYNAGVNQLTAGQFTSETEKFEKMLNNTDIIVDSATFLAEKLPSQIQQLFGIIIGGVATIVSAILTKNGTQNLTSIIGASRTNGSALGSVLWGRPAAASSFLDFTPVAGAGIGALAAAGGAAWTIADAIKSSNELGSAGAGFLKGFTGSDYAYRGLDYQAANTNIDWLEVLTTGGKGGLIGGGIGAMASGIGAIPGAIVGAAGGALSNLATQIVEKGKLKDYIEAQKALNDSTSKLNIAQIQYETALKKTSTAQDLLAIITDKNNVSEEERLEAITDIQSLYPGLFTNVKEISDWTEKESTLLQSKIERELNLARIEFNKQSRESASALSGLENTSNITGMVSNDTALAFLKYLDSTNGGVDTTGSDWKAFAKSIGITYSDDQSYTNLFDRLTYSLGFTPNIPNVFAPNIKKIYTGAKTGNQSLVDWFTNNQNYTSKVSEFENSEVGRTYLDTLESQYLDLSNWDTSIINLINDGADEATIKGNISNVLGRIATLNALVATAPGYGVDWQLHSGSFDIAGLTALMNKKGWKISIPEFATGEDYVAFDNMPALLHRGEMVLNASEADNYRRLAGQITFEYHNRLAAGARVEAIPATLITNIDATIMTISTNIIEILSVITEIRDGVLHNPLPENIYPEDINTYTSPYVNMNNRF